MVSIVLLAADPARPSPSPEAVVRTLTALIPGAIEGVVKDVVLAGPPENSDLRRIADHAGCELVEGEPTHLLQSALAATRDAIVLVLLAGDIPGEGFVDELSDLLLEGPPSALMRRRAEGLWQTILPRTAPISGILAPKAQLSAGQPMHFLQLVGRASGSRLLETRTRSVR